MSEELKAIIAGFKALGVDLERTTKSVERFTSDGQGNPIRKLEPIEVVEYEAVPTIRNNQTVEVTEATIDLIKKAFWWSAEFTALVHSNNIRSAWEDYYERNLDDLVAVEPKEVEVTDEMVDRAYNIFTNTTEGTPWRRLEAVLVDVLALLFFQPATLTALSRSGLCLHTGVLMAYLS